MLRVDGWFERVSLTVVSLLPAVAMDSPGGTLDAVGRFLDKAFTVCAAIVILLLVLFILWILSLLSKGGGSRG